MEQIGAIGSGEGCDIGAMQLDGSCAAIGVGEIHQGGAIVPQIEVHQIPNAKALAAPVYVVQNCLPACQNRS